LHKQAQRAGTMHVHALTVLFPNLSFTFQMVTVYNFDEYGWSGPPCTDAPPEVELTGPNKKKKFTAKSNSTGLNAPTTIEINISLEDLLATGFYLPRINVIRNMSDKSICEDCHRKVPPELIPDMYVCDGCYPTNVGLTYPPDSQGRHFACHRAYLCVDCYPKRRIIAGLTELWFCKACAACKPADYIDVWGFNIHDPRDIIHHGSESLLQWPSLHPEVINETSPAVSYKNRNKLLSEAKQAAIDRRRMSSTGDAERSNRACTSFDLMARSLHLSDQQQEAILKVLHLIHADGNLVGGNQSGDLLLPRTTETLHKAATGSLIFENDVPVHTVTIDTTGLLQGHKSLLVHVCNPLDVIQGMLLDDAFPAGSLFLQKKGQSAREFVMLDDSCDIKSKQTPLRGHEAYDGDRWRDLLETCTGYLLAICIHSDAVHKGAFSFHPWSLSILNFPRTYREHSGGMKKFAMSEPAKIRVPRGSTMHETLTQEQRWCKLSIMNKIAMTVYAQFEEAARNGPIQFWVRDPSGNEHLLPFDIRLMYCQQDIEEWLQCNGSSAHLCGDCLGSVAAFQSGYAGTAYRPHLSVKDSEHCSTAQRRTPQSYFSKFFRRASWHAHRCN